MTDSGKDSEQGLIYEDLLPLKWQELAGEPTSLEMAKLDAVNEEVLRFIDVLDEHPSESTGEHSSINQELAKVEIKFDLLLNMLTQLLGVYFPLPAPVNVRLTPFGVQWMSHTVINTGIHGLVEIYLNSRCPRALVFPARVEHAEQDGQEYRVSVQFSEMSDPIRERLEKMIFRHHRRRVALARRRLTPDPELPSS
jgi:hypothetical protein